MLLEQITPALLKETPEAERIKILTQALQHFTQASGKLEERYANLKKEAEQLRGRLELKEQEIARSARMATLGNMAAAIAHEVRNPLGAIKLFASMLKQDVADRPAAVELVAGIGKSVSTIETTVSNILLLSRNKTLQFAPINLDRLLDSQIEQHLSSTGKIKVVKNYQADSLISANEDALKQVFCNLLINAQHALRGTGTISLSTLNAGSQSVEITLADSGPGISADVMERLFEPFVTSKNEGTGLGLAIVKQIIEAHGGRITARNAQGARFVILLPRCKKI